MARLKVLVAEKLAATGVDALREHFDVDLGHEWDRAQLEERIGDYHGVVIRSATQVDAALIERADSLRVIGRGESDVPRALDRAPQRFDHRAFRRHDQNRQGVSFSHANCTLLYEWGAG